MLKPSKNIKSLKHQSSTCRANFNLLCWNIAKLSQKDSFKNYLRDLITKESLDILLLQEIKEELVKEIEIEDFSFVLSANIETKKHLFGVMSLFDFSCHSHKELLTNSKELSFLTHKSSLMTLHKTKNDTELLIVNIHAINFVTTKVFQKELDSIEAQISSFKGALIVAGDFNTWSKKRVVLLESFAKRLSLNKVEFQDEKNLKRVFKETLDYVFYRALHVQSAKVLKCPKLSDHNPIVVGFSL
jgi:endonuclease/exonuclease/phosphatase (EEP) superfamily protein YafD